MSEAGYGTVELLVPVLCNCRCVAPAAWRPQNNVKRDASRRARLAVWCSALTESRVRWGWLLRPNEVASQSQTFSKRNLKAKTTTVNRRIEAMTLAAITE